MMSINPRRHRGGSSIGNLLLLVAFAYGVFIGIQYVPQWFEARAVESILEDMKQSQRQDPVDTVQDAQAKLVRMFQINEMNDMTDNIVVSGSRGGLVIDVTYQRDLNLGFETRSLLYNHSVSL